MANDEYLNDYRQFFRYFDETLDPNDQLPVKLASYRLFKKEVVGAIFNWTNQYLSDKKCPWHLISFLSRVVIEKTRKRCKKQPVQCGFNPSDNAYEPLKLMHTVIEVINEVCFNYKSSLSVQNRQNMAVSYPLPAPEDVYSVVSMSALKNSRRKMEDRFIVIHDLNTIFTKQDATPSHYYAVFDGHNGEHAAVYSANHLHQYLAESTNFNTNPEQAIRDAFSKTDSMFMKKCKTENISGGTTAVCALLLPKEKSLYVAWVGDSQAVLVDRGKILPCVIPHKPDREDERQRIVEEGGMVVHFGVWRVNGQLGISRAIGDAEHKPYVTAVPEMVKVSLEGEEDFIVLGSDGLWDHVSEIEIAKVVYDAVHSDPDKAQVVSRELVQLAKHNGSTDNISVIVVYLRDPHQIAAGPRWNNRLVSMDTLDNANNPFAIPNKTNNVVDSITAQTEDGLLLNFAEGLKKSDDLPNNDLIKMLEKSNCGRLSPDFDKEDNLGPETNVDNPDSGPASPNFDVSKRQQREALNNNQNCNPFNDIEKSLELNLNLKEGTFEGLLMSPTEEECVQPPNSVHNVSQLIDAGADSDSEEDEEEWNYVRGEEANKENAKPSQLSSQVAEEEEEDDIENAMSQLNPNAAEFIPSPARAVASPLGRLLDEEQVLSRSPKKPPAKEVDLNVPDMCDFEKDILQKPHEIEAAFDLNALDQDNTEKPHENGHREILNNETNAINALNSRQDEFHFGPNAAPFTPSKLLDQSEASSTRANFGDESALDTSFNDSLLSQDQNDFVQKDDPMSMSFHQDRTDDSNIFDLNKVHLLPENVDEFIANKEENTNSLFDDTISDLTEHYPMGNPEESKQIEIELTTDLDHEDQNIVHLLTNQSSTPIDERSKSPFALQTLVDEERAISPRDETQTPIEETSGTSSVREFALPEAKECSEAREEVENGIKSPFGQNELSSPFAEECLISPVEEHKLLSSPYEEKELYSTEEEKDICSPVEEKDLCCLIRKQNEPLNEEKEVFEEKDLVSEKDIIQEVNYVIEDKESASEKEVTEEKDVSEEKYTPEPPRDIISPVEAITSPDSSQEVISPVQERLITSPQHVENERIDVTSPVQEKEIFLTVFDAPASEQIVSSVEIVAERLIISPVQDSEITSPVQEESNVYSPIHEKEIASPVQDEEITSVVQGIELGSLVQGDCSLVEGGKAEDSSLEQEVSTTEIKVDDVVPIKPSESIDEINIEATTCDISESSEQKHQIVASDPSMKNDDLFKFETEKSDEEKTKENLECTLLLDKLNTVLSLEEKCVESLCDISTEPEVSVSSQPEESNLTEAISFSLAEQNGVPSSLAIDTTNVDVHSQPTPEADQVLISDSNFQCSLNKSLAETSSVNTTDVISVFDQSLLGEVQCPISPNLSMAVRDISSEAITSCNVTNDELLKTEESMDILLSSPIRQQQQDLSTVTSTPLAKKLEAEPLSTEVKTPVEDKKSKEADKKTTKSKATPATTAKRTSTSRTSLTSARTTTATPSPKPAPKSATKTNTATSKLNSNIKTETATSKVASKPLSSAAPKPSTTSSAPKATNTTAKVPPSSRTNLRPTNPKITVTNGTAKPPTKPSTGAIKKPEGSSSRSATSTGVSKPAPATARTNLASARSATSTAAPKPRPNTLKPAPTRTVAAPKPTTASARPTTTAPRVPPTSRITATKTSSSLATKEVSKTLSKPRSVTDKQVKETANKLTAASRTVSKTTSTIQSLAKSTTVTKKAEITGSKTTTSRTNATSSRPPIKRPADTSKTTTTKLVGKPKQNGFAPVVTEKILVDSGSKELSSVIEQFIKDNSPVDNKLITEQLSESAAN